MQRIRAHAHAWVRTQVAQPCPPHRWYSPRSTSGTHGVAAATPGDVSVVNQRPAAQPTSGAKSAQPSSPVPLSLAARAQIHLDRKRKNKRAAAWRTVQTADDIQRQALKSIRGATSPSHVLHALANMPGKPGWMLQVSALRKIAHLCRSAPVTTRAATLELPAMQRLLRDTKAAVLRYVADPSAGIDIEGSTAASGHTAAQVVGALPGTDGRGVGPAPRSLAALAWSLHSLRVADSDTLNAIAVCAAAELESDAHRAAMAPKLQEKASLRQRGRQTATAEQQLLEAGAASVGPDFLEGDWPGCSVPAADMAGLAWALSQNSARVHPDALAKAMRALQLCKLDRASNTAQMLWYAADVGALHEGMALHWLVHAVQQVHSMAARDCVMLLRALAVDAHTMRGESLASILTWPEVHAVLQGHGGLSGVHLHEMDGAAGDKLGAAALPFLARVLSIAGQLTSEQWSTCTWAAARCGLVQGVCSVDASTVQPALEAALGPGQVQRLVQDGQVDMAQALACAAAAALRPVLRQDELRGTALRTQHVYGLWGMQAMLGTAALGGNQNEAGPGAVAYAPTGDEVRAWSLPSGRAAAAAAASDGSASPEACQGLLASYAQAVGAALRNAGATGAAVARTPLAAGILQAGYDSPALNAAEQGDGQQDLLSAAESIAASLALGPTAASAHNTQDCWHVAGTALQALGSGQALSQTGLDAITACVAAQAAASDVLPQACSMLAQALAQAPVLVPALGPSPSGSELRAALRELAHQMALRAEYSAGQQMLALHDMIARYPGMPVTQALLHAAAAAAEEEGNAVSLAAPAGQAALVNLAVLGGLTGQLRTDLRAAASAAVGCALAQALPASDAQEHAAAGAEVPLCALPFTPALQTTPWWHANTATRLLAERLGMVLALAPPATEVVSSGVWLGAGSEASGERIVQSLARPLAVHSASRDTRPVLQQLRTFGRALQQELAAQSPAADAEDSIVALGASSDDTVWPVPACLHVRGAVPLDVHVAVPGVLHGGAARAAALAGMLRSHRRWAEQAPLVTLHPSLLQQPVEYAAAYTADVIAAVRGNRA